MGSPKPLKLNLHAESKRLDILGSEGYSSDLKGNIANSLTDTCTEGLQPAPNIARWNPLLSSTIL